MELIIQQLSQRMLEEITEIVKGKGLRLAEILPKIESLTNRCAQELLGRLIEATDEALRADKAGRKKEGLQVVRLGEKRTILTQLGELCYHRTYYRNTGTGEYTYPIDQIVGVSPYCRVEAGLGEQLVRESRQVSYQKAAEICIDNQVSRQTVLNKIRQAVPVLEEPQVKKQLAELHIDADEDHVAMQSPSRPRRKIVPLVSVYEGMEKVGARNRCKNVFHISPYGQDPDALWEEVLTRIEQRYDLTHTKIYLHGDGAAWIAKGLEWLPNATFVLDPYHKNKAIRQLLAGYDPRKAPQLRKDLNQALEDMDEEYFAGIVSLLLTYSPQREKKIREAATYLRSHMPSIAIRSTDPSAMDGGATEPHVSHVLSCRLSSRPKGWSDKTLQFFAPILANGPHITLQGAATPAPKPIAQKALAATQNKCLCRKTTAVRQSSLPVLTQGKQSQLFTALKALASCRPH